MLTLPNILGVVTCEVSHSLTILLFRRLLGFDNSEIYRKYEDGFYEGLYENLYLIQPKSEMVKAATLLTYNMYYLFIKDIIEKFSILNKPQSWVVAQNSDVCLFNFKIFCEILYIWKFLVLESHMK